MYLVWGPQIYQFLHPQMNEREILGNFPNKGGGESAETSEIFQLFGGKFTPLILDCQNENNKSKVGLPP